MAKKNDKESYLTKKQLKQALANFGADQERRLDDKLKAISNQVNLSLSGSRTLLTDHAMRINALTDFCFSNLGELSVMIDGLWEQAGGRPESVPPEHLDKLRETIHERISEFQGELKKYQEHAKKRMAEMVDKVKSSIAPAKPEPAVRQIDLSDELPMDESLEMGSEKE